MAEISLSQIQKLLCVCYVTLTAMLLFHKTLHTLTDSCMPDSSLSHYCGYGESLLVIHSTSLVYRYASPTGLLLPRLGQVGNTCMGTHEDVAGV